MKVVITGIAGFLGSHLAKALADAGYDVWGIDNFSTGKASNLEGLPRTAFLQADVSGLWPREVKHLKNVTAVFHLASPASPEQFPTLPLSILRANGLGTFQAAALADARRAHFILASSSEVYGQPQEHPQKESYAGCVNPVSARGCYDEGKRFAEAVAMGFFRQVSLKVSIVRIHNTYGPRMPDDGRLVPTLVRQALRGEPLTVHGDGHQTRSLTYVDDMVAGLMAVLEYRWAGPGSHGAGVGVINLGSPQEVTVLHVAQTINRLAGGRSELRFVPGRLDDPVRRCPDISRARQLLKWEPHVPLEDGLARTIAWYKK